MNEQPNRPTTSTQPRPRLPDYAGANVRGIIPALLGPTAWNELPTWMPAPVAASRRAVLLVLDGLGWGQLRERSELAPTLAGMQGGPITTVAPTTTATALTSITTGLTPAEHGLVGYRVAFGGEVLNVLKWCVDDTDRRRSLPPAQVQPYRAFLDHEVPVVSPAELQGSAFTEAHLRGSRPVGWRAASSMAVEVGRLLRSGERFVYAYYSGIDRIAHERGFGEFYDAELRAADEIVAAIAEQLTDDAVLLVTADHGQVQVGDSIVTLPEEIRRELTLQSGEGRFRWLHVRPGAVEEVLAAAHQHFGDSTWVVTKEQTIDECWFGSVIAPPIASRLGDIALVPFAPISFDDPADTGPFELICRHGSLTADEVEVPLVALGPN